MSDTPAEAVAAAAALLTKAMTVPGKTPSPGELAANTGLARLMVEAAVAAERERIRLRLTACRTCQKVHEWGAETGHANRAPWQARDEGALAFLDEMLGDGPVP